jgi:hypothetical protein
MHITLSGKQGRKRRQLVDLGIFERIISKYVLNDGLWGR